MAAPVRRKLIRLTDEHGRTLCFMAFLGSRAAGWRTFEPHEAPSFEGKSAVFEVTRDRKGRWIFGRRVDGAD